MSGASGPQLRRIVAALGGWPHDEAKLLLAAHLARRLDAELAGLFLEDAELLEVASLSVPTYLVHTTERRRLDLVSVERGFRVEARRLRRLVASVSERQLVRWSFAVRRVRTCEDVARQLGADELLILAPQGRAERRRRLGEAMACHAVPAILILEPGRRRPRSHVAIFDEGQDTVLTAGARLAGALEAALTVLPVRNGKGAPPADAERSLHDWHEGLPLPAEIARPVAGDAGSLQEALERLDPDVVVIGREGRVSNLGADTLDALIGPRAVLIPGARR
ncbi:MAG: hypothetical protein ACLFV8_06580 [Alphaproteobacteria bacterium]